MTRLERKIENAKFCLEDAIMFKYGKRKFLEQAVKKLTEILMSDKYRDELDRRGELIRKMKKIKKGTKNMKNKRKIMPAGTAVKMVNCLEAENYAGRVWTTKSDPWRLESGTWVVLLEGYKGGFSVDCLEAVK